MSNGTTPAPSPNDDPPLPALASTGIKLLSEAVIPGGSLLLEKKVGSGVGAAAVGILGGAAMGAVFGPLGYLLTRVGASVVSYSSAIAPPPTPPKPPDIAPVVSGLNQLNATLAPIAAQMAADRSRLTAAAVAPAEFVTRSEFHEAVNSLHTEIRSISTPKRGSTS